MLLDKGAILEELKLETETVTIGKGEIIVSELGADEYVALYTDSRCQTKGKLDMTKFTPLLIAKCIVDAQGNRLFDDDEAPLLYKGKVKKFQQLSEVALRLNGLSAPIEESAKN